MASLLLDVVNTYAYFSLSSVSCWFPWQSLAKCSFFHSATRSSSQKLPYTLSLFLLSLFPVSIASGFRKLLSSGKHHWLLPSCFCSRSPPWDVASCLSPRKTTSPLRAEPITWVAIPTPPQHLVQVWHSSSYPASDGWSETITVGAYGHRDLWCHRLPSEGGVVSGQLSWHGFWASRPPD